MPGKRKREEKKLQVRAIPIPVGAQHPNVPHPDILPQHEFTMAVVAPKGSGKTTWICNMLDYYQGYFHNIFIISPTLNSDEKWDYVRKRPLRGENKALKKFLEKLDQGDDIIGKPTVVQDTKKFEPQIPEENMMTEYDSTKLVELMEEQMEMVEFLKSKGATKHLADRILIIWDDMVGSALFNNKKDNPFKRCNTNHRHYSFSMMMVAQAYKELPKTVRTNVTGLVTWEIPNEGEVKVLYEEHPIGMKRPQWEEVYQYCTEGEFDFMYVNYKRPKRLRIMKNFDQVVYMGTDGEDV